MKTWVRKSLNVGVLSAGFLLISGGAAHADWTTGYNAGLLNGNQFDTTLQLPVNVCGNSIAVLGFADASCGGGAAAVDTESATTEDWTTGYNAGVANGNQLDTTLQVPVNVSGNAVSVLGFSSASSQGGAYAVKGGMASDNGRGHGHGHGRGHGHGGGNGGGNGGYTGNNNGGYAADADDYTESTGNRTEDWTSGYNAGLLNGNQFDTTLQLPVNLSGNAISLFGFSSAQSAGGAWAVKGESASTESATTEDWTTGYNAGLLNGNQFDTTVQAPINVCGNAIAVLGFSSASCGGGAVAVDGDGWGGGNGGGNGHGHGHGHGHGGDNGDWDDDDNGNGGGNGGYGDDDADNDGGYGNGGSNGNPGAYGNAAGNASNMSSHGASASHGKAKTKKVTSEHSRGNGAGTGTANDGGYGNGGGNGNNNGGYGNGQNNGGYGNGNGNGNGGYGNGAGNGDDDRGHGRGHGHHGRGNGGGWSNGGGATAVKNSCSDWTTGYNAGLLNGNQFDTTLQVPVNISGNAISLFGFSQASSQGGAVAYSC
ncbi:chaplin family protein [Dactylosporangium sp. NPDC006015]|uniref:chaplin family protein n=1 Tax=Dactylosporangium sp. NPDC006015 TaxID=3154576 RepID=UPI0033B3D2F3